MDEGLLHHLSLTLFGVGISLSNAVNAYRSLDAFSVLMILGGIGLAVAAGRPIVNGEYKNYKGYRGNWTYLLAAGALMMVAGALLRISAM